MVRNYVKTIRDLEDLYYGGIIGQSNSYLQKNDPMLSDTTGIWQQLYGAKCWVNMNLAANTFGIMPKKPWLRAGWRAITGRASASVTGGLPENSTLPATIKPTFAQISTKPRQIAHTFNTSEIMQFLGTVDDSLDDVMSLMREYMAKEHAEHINRMMQSDPDNSGNPANSGNNILSIDTIVASYAEHANATDASGNNSFYTAAHDIYGLNRHSGATYADSYVNYATSDRALTLTLIDSLFQNVWANGGNPKVMVTGYDSLMKIQQLLQTQQRWVETTKVTPGVNGIQGVPGVQAGFIVATYNQVPIIPDKDTLADLAASSRIYLLDTDYLWFETAKPTQYFETGMLSGDPFGINFLGQEGLYRTMGELKVMFPKAQAKLRDIL